MAAFFAKAHLTGFAKTFWPAPIFCTRCYESIGVRDFFSGGGS